MPHRSLLSAVLRTFVQAIGEHSHPVDEPISDVVAGLPTSLDKLIIAKIFKQGDLSLEQIGSLFSLFKELDTYLTKLTNLLQKVKDLLPSTGTNDDNRTARMLLVKELEQVMLRWAMKRQDGLQMVSNITK